MDLLQVFLGFILVAFLSGVGGVMLDRWSGRRLSDFGLATYPTVVMAAAGAWYAMYASHETQDAVFLALFFLIWVVLIWSMLPAIAIRRVERFEKKLFREHPTQTLTGRQARRRLAMTVPFWLHPATIFFSLMLLAKRGKMVYGHRPLPKAIETSSPRSEAWKKRLNIRPMTREEHMWNSRYSPTHSYDPINIWHDEFDD